MSLTSLKSYVKRHSTFQGKDGLYLDGELNKISETIDRHIAQTVTNSDDISTNTTDIATNTTDIATNTTDIASLSSTVSGLSTSVTDLSHFATDYENKAAVQAATIAAYINFVRTAGYTDAGDFGGGLYARVNSEPAHNGKIQSTDGAWWELREAIPTPQMFGAVPDGTTDCLSPINDAIVYANEFSGIVYFPRGLYYVTDTILIDTDVNVSLMGAGMNAVTITAGQNAGNSVYNDIIVLLVLGSDITVSDLSLRGKGGWQDTGSFGASNATLLVAEGGENTFRKLRIDGGSQCLDVYGYDHIFDDLVISNAYADLLRVNESGNFFRRIKADSGDTTNSVDQSWPARLNSHHYDVGDIVTYDDGSNDCVLSCTQAGTTAGSGPTNLNYGLDITDGSAKWRLSAPVGLNCIHCLTNGSDGGEWHFTQIDLSGDFANSLLVDDQSGNDLAIVSFHQSIFSAQINISSARWVSFSQCEMPTQMSTNDKDTTITGCKSDGGLTVGGAFTGAGNINIS